MKKMIKWVVVMLAVGAGPAALAAPYVLLPNNTRVDGTEIRSKQNGDIVLITPQGQRIFNKGQYLKAVADQPPAMEQAKQLIAQKKLEDALVKLNEVVKNYQFLEWDNAARNMIAQTQMQKGDAAGAVDTFEAMFKTMSDPATVASMQWSYREALVKAKQFDKLQKQLDDAITKGSRADAAKAQILRGDVKAAQGNQEGAVIDYLRSAILFESEKAVVPEALYKAAEGLEKMRDPRAKDLYAKIVQEYSTSPYADKAKGR